MNKLSEIHIPDDDGKQGALAVFYKALKGGVNTTVEQAEKEGKKSCELFTRRQVTKINLWSFGLTIHFKSGYLTLHITPAEVENVADFVDEIYPGKGVLVFEHFAKNKVKSE